jgi:hypothetical protein
MKVKHQKKMIHIFNLIELSGERPKKNTSQLIILTIQLFGSIDRLIPNLK